MRDKFILRSVIDTSSRAITDAFSGPEDVEALMDAAETRLFQIRGRGRICADGLRLAALVQEAVTSFEKFIVSKGKIQGLSTWFGQLDRKSNGLKPGDMFVVAARPSMGKTSFLLNIMEHIALKEKKPTLFFSCEIPAVQIEERLLFARSGVRCGEIVRSRHSDPIGDAAF
ncbi:DnaB-like helicase C-terminal domain-containing protein [uncultured Akkermansia sp.]|uniref:DnaB-like helicase C-terminal domain-containing protein n=1 Tax=uncultured Akkermansia sp. TaxID=512294 RepID=UPI002620856F|nr:DnaB-like helicase C-terminal domain-containing protein [uncultured Akkermansia sp.]